MLIVACSWVVLVTELDLLGHTLQPGAGGFLPGSFASHSV